MVVHPDLPNIGKMFYKHDHEKAYCVMILVLDFSSSLSVNVVLKLHNGGIFSSKGIMQLPQHSTVLDAILHDVGNVVLQTTDLVIP